MSDLRKAAQQALDAWDDSMKDLKDLCVAMDAIRTALEQKDVPEVNFGNMEQQAEPVAWTLTETLNKRETTTRGYLWFSNPQNCSWTPLYPTPPQRQPLTDEMRKQMKEASDSIEMRGAFANGWLSAEAAHGIKEGT